jgi:hypothetical protein
VSWLSASASRAAINLSFTRKDNLADITAKSGSQTIAGCLVGTGLGVIASPFIGSAFVNIFPVFFFLASVQLYSLYRAISVVELNVLNQQRTEILIEHYLDTYDSAHVRADVLTPAQVAEKEQFVLPRRAVNINPRLEKFVSSVDDLKRVKDKFRHENYLIKVNNSRIDLLFDVNATTKDVIQGMLNAMYMKRYKDTDQKDLEWEGLKFARVSLFPFQHNLKEAGWVLSHDFIEELPNRFELIESKP